MLAQVPEVRIMVPPKGIVQLWAWIQCSDDRGWWACLGWIGRHHDENILCTGYASPDELRKRPDADYAYVPRLHQRGTPATWPPPAPVIGDYGRLSSGSG